MKIVWKKKDESGKKRPLSNLISSKPNLPFESAEEEARPLNHDCTDTPASDPDSQQLAESFESEGIQLAESGRYREALTKWETAIVLMPEKAKLHEQKAQVLLEIGDTWNALKAAARATELEPAWSEAWITLGRAQLNFGEPGMAIESFDKALLIQPSNEEAQSDRRTAYRLIKRQKQLHSESRYKVGDNVGSVIPHMPLVPESDGEHQ
ncbi:tetratricopeptide repeat protein 33 [Phalaenopsis equestris]|uniref:tetratricopeptide repeat protein 33 n=1 Tax=Phalaenopsis equestris TaxID=78828 RepID=UPI0009E4267A|nr:tetratricopeptide repeat protein 33 [Phalaenopsis equestris]